MPNAKGEKSKQENTTIGITDTFRNYFAKIQQHCLQNRCNLENASMKVRVIVKRVKVWKTERRVV